MRAPRTDGRTDGMVYLSRRRGKGKGTKYARNRAERGEAREPPVDLNFLEGREARDVATSGYPTS